jgi:hypothetical protein
MLRTALMPLFALVVVAAAACPGAADAAKEAATDVGAAPHAQLEDARTRVEKAEKKEQAAVDAAAAIKE